MVLPSILSAGLNAIPGTFTLLNAPFDWVSLAFHSAFPWEAELARAALD